ncbi:right-handed parallel beta-helix repeat-containing protein [bacterium]|nr:right-handed parallel beta-helix repeat-containing protein [bacterium]
MKSYCAAVIALALLSLISGMSLSATLEVERGSDLQSVIDFASDGDTLVLGAKTFEAEPSAFTEPLCGNCDEARTEVTATVGFVIRDKALVLIGADRSETRLVTNAGYGLYIENSRGTVIANLTITGGVRGADGAATDAALVVRGSEVLIQDCDLVDNDNRDTSIVVGIAGVAGREGADITLRACTIMNNSWDGVALYRGATAHITDCVIADGRGAGIGVTWDATCVAFRNEIRGYWKGIGAFGNSLLVARNNVVRDCIGWGLIATGSSQADFVNNVVYHNGNCGVAPWSPESRGRIVNNIIVGNGWKESWVCPCVGVWNNGDWAKWRFTNNIVWDNASANYEEIYDQTGLNGNLSADPMFVGPDDFRIKDGSPVLHAGDTSIFNTDGTVSHIGLYGGPQAPLETK